MVEKKWWLLHVKRYGKEFMQNLLFNIYDPTLPSAGAFLIQVKLPSTISFSISSCIGLGVALGS